MPKPYTSAQKDTLIDQLLADVAELKERLAERQPKPGKEDKPDREIRREAGTRRLAARQETDATEMDQPQVTMRPAVERVRRTDGKLVRRVVRPR